MKTILDVRGKFWARDSAAAKNFSGERRAIRAAIRATIEMKTSSKNFRSLILFSRNGDETNVGGKIFGGKISTEITNVMGNGN